MKRPAANVPTGNHFVFPALAYPLPDFVQARLRSLSKGVADSENGHDGPEFRALDDYLKALREVLGQDHLRREFLPVGTARA